MKFLPNRVSFLKFTVTDTHIWTSIFVRMFKHNLSAAAYVKINPSA